MSFLGKPHGIFSLKDSDNFIGSFICIDDLCEIFNVSIDDLSEINFVDINGVLYADECSAQIAWYNGKVKNAPAFRINGAKCSLDELVLKKIINDTYHEALIEHQVKWGRRSIDFKITINGVSKLIEFHGPYHFVRSQYGYPKDPILRKQQAEKDFGIEYIIWPYWIPRCRCNIRAIFEDNICGIGAIWSANVHFSDFYFQNSAEIIHVVSSIFRASRNQSYGYFYESGKSYSKPEHPIIKEIKDGVMPKDVLLPKGFFNESVWLPYGIA